MTVRLFQGHFRRYLGTYLEPNYDLTKKKIL